jgi:tetratricopeptide (TPR) repeat protein
LRVSARVQVYVVVSAVAAAAAASVVALTAVTADHPPKPRTGKPPFVADLTAPKPLAAEVRRAVGSVGRLEDLAAANPRSSFVQVNLGLARYWRRDDAGAVAAWRAARRVDPNTPSAIHAGDFLHPGTPPGLPMFQPTFTRAKTEAQRRLLEGIRFQRLGRPVSAERQFAAAATLAPNDPDALVAAAVGRFDKDRPAAAFSRLGPLTQRFPRSQSVRFHLGLLSIWIADFADARKQLRLAVAAAPGTRFAREAQTLLKSLEGVGTK